MLQHALKRWDHFFGFADAFRLDAECMSYFREICVANKGMPTNGLVKPIFPLRYHPEMRVVEHDVFHRNLLDLERL